MSFRISIKQFGLSIGLSVLLLMSNPLLAETADHQQHEHQPDSTTWIGMYNGSTPCNDCIGVKTTLALNKNNSYIMITQFLGKSEREYVEKGKIVWSDAHHIQLTAKDGKLGNRYLLGDNSLTQLDEQGKAFTGKQAERYVLRRHDITANPPTTSHSH